MSIQSDKLIKYNAEGKLIETGVVTLATSTTDGGATTALDNLADTAINTDLLFTPSNTSDIGSPTAFPQYVYADNLWLQAGALNLNVVGDAFIVYDSGSSTLVTQTAGTKFIWQFPSTVHGLEIDDDQTPGNTAMLLYDVDTSSVQRVTVGVADSGGVGFKVLRIPN